MNRILYFVHYNKHNDLSDHVLYLLKNIRSLYTRVEVISNNSLSLEQNDKISKLSDEILLRENKGFDFGAWKDGILKDGWDKLSQYDSLTLMNDTCFGPIFDLDKTYTEMENTDADFWGLTNNFYKGKNNSEHIQSYFLCFNKKVINSTVFRLFWNKCKNETLVENVILKYEIRLTKILKKAGFRYSVFHDKHSVPQIKTNLVFRRPDIIIKEHVPLLKIKSFIDFSYPKYLINLLKNETNYPVSNIYNYFNEYYNPSVTFFIQDKLVNYNIDSNLCSPSIAIHFNINFIDIFKKYAYLLNNIIYKYDLFITTDTAEKKIEIGNFLNDQPCNARLKEIYITPNHGRDILPWLSLKGALESYDFVGHFHTKKSSDQAEWVGVSWNDDILCPLLNNINHIINNFIADNKIGIIIPEIPYIFRKTFFLDYIQDKTMQSLLNIIWGKFKCKKQIDFKKLTNIIMPVGNMFWYRPAALKPLLEYEYLSADIPREPLPNTTLLHGIERILVYLAWNEGFDYRIITPNPPNESVFLENYIINKLLGSKEYQFGKFIVSKLRFIKRILKIITFQ
jgi:rhamnosyltransferase